MPQASGLYYFLHEAGGPSRPPVILLPGAGADHLVWSPEIRRLPGFNVYALDLPGHGKSEGAGLQSLEAYARSVVGLMDAIGLWKAVFVGHSMGGGVALSLALDHPQRTAGLCLISCAARLPVSRQILDNAGNASTFGNAVQRLNELACSAQTTPRLAEQNLKRILAVRPSLFHGDLLACDRFDASERLDTVSAPALVICGTEDRLTPLSEVAALAARLPSAALQTVDGAGHLVILEQPKRIARILSVFLSTIPYQPGA